MSHDEDRPGGVLFVLGLLGVLQENGRGFQLWSEVLTWWRPISVLG
jgi:hypothetical protein